jgi:hypothetical protein
MIRLMKREEEEEERPPGDYYVVSAEFGTYFVSAETAARLGRALDRPWLPRWVKFTDLSGARVWARASGIESIQESTERARVGERAFHRARRMEEKADRRWDEDDY